MYGLIREEEPFGANPSTTDIARHIYSRMPLGKIVIVTDRSAAILSALRKQWIRRIRKLQSQKSGTINIVKIAQFTDMILRMQGVRFSATRSQDVCL